MQPRSPSSTKALIAAWLGWAFDGLDGYLYIILAVPLVTKLLTEENGGPLSVEQMKDVGWKAALIQATFLVGWAVGGAVFGRIGDRLGRARTLTLTVLTYAVFTGAVYFATSWWHLLIFRFIAALGIGGEWAAGSALVSETLHSKHRAWASATLQSGYIVGCIAASFVVKAMADLDPRAPFLVGILPALLTLWIRSAVPEPEHWVEAVKSSAPPRIRELFTGALARTTILLTLLTSIALTTAWAFLFFGPQLVQRLPEVAGKPKPEVQKLVSWISIIYLTVNIFANYFATYLARFIGYRWAFFLLMGASLVAFCIAFRAPPRLENITLLYCIIAFFALGLFGLFPLYIPPLFPVLVRTLGAGFTYNVGRLVSAAGTLLALAGASSLATADGVVHALWWIGLLFIPGMFVCLFLPEPPKDGAVRAA
ncbi:MAG: MFS transporter [Phycisphaerae bacterium]|nr:MFS transporter [Phycisphaerae bacterium]